MCFLEKQIAHLLEISLLFILQDGREAAHVTAKLNIVAIIRSKVMAPRSGAKDPLFRALFLHCGSQHGV